MKEEHMNYQMVRTGNLNEDRQMTQDERSWCFCAMRTGGDFVKAFANACLRADDENFSMLAPVLVRIMAKYAKYSRREDNRG